MRLFSQPPVSLKPRARAALSDAAPEVFWTDRPERPEARPPLTGIAPRTGLLIVGAGFTGLWAAIQAKTDDPAQEVVVVEAGRLGDGASGRNGGFVEPSLTHGLAQGLACWPDEMDVLTRLGAENFAAIGAALTAHGIDADFHQPGELTLALSEHQVAAVRES
ncbi:MAG: FAD-dependent oxidoreductase, partial [Dermatophilaceae bacterium]